MVLDSFAYNDGHWAPLNLASPHFRIKMEHVRYKIQLSIQAILTSLKFKLLPDSESLYFRTWYRQNRH